MVKIQVLLDIYFNVTPLSMERIFRAFFNKK